MIAFVVIYPRAGTDIALTLDSQLFPFRYKIFEKAPWGEISESLFQYILWNAECGMRNAESDEAR